MKYKLPPLPTFEEWCRIISPSEPGTQIASVENFVKAYAIAAIDAQPSVVQQEPLGFISPKQVERIVDPDGEFGAYIPMRKTPAGNFTLAVYTHPAQQAKPQPLSSDRDARIAELERELAEARKDAERYRLIRCCDDIDLIVKLTKEPGRWNSPYPVILQAEAIVEKFMEPQAREEQQTHGITKE